MIKTLYERLVKMCSIAASKTRGMAIPEELLGAAYEGWLDAVRRWRRNMGASFANYSWTRIMGAIKDYMRSLNFFGTRNKNKPMSIDASEFMHIADNNMSASHSLNDEQTSDALWKAIMDLPDEWRRVVHGHYYHGLSMTELGAMRGVSGAAVGHVKRKALVRLKELMA